ncbi:hypothetical protein SEA_NUEVOMUNDO_55 [Mycobacterium phage NuevoMundo]|uniref:Uncharacterized protein n=2 Tax=Bixzunavirus TaxID=680114 RepID=A0A2D1G7T5_9CAUD|nr:hypothetical protein KHO58_gp057 [Mycobacterium phage Bigswole]YP_010057693.1 hypothetical protein KHO61_gp053 [Mycobacterium phage Mangeria]ATN87732.1 hypothetical protein SEA_BIGSWOLE_57 [Mycobacterium phage Bigswole]AVJ48332.1 hypothetical protein SEA_NUEVOMUNDO_55 [Mycobacterium phage NuevoMundo]QHB47622.1 hypothetical protein SEA_MANGERIA_53 [Mycobacterium phage Mangeria]
MAVELAGPVYYRINKSTAMYAQYPYDLTYLDVPRLQRYRPMSLWVGFKTRAEAEAFAKEKGWIKVSSWKEAEKLAAPEIERQRAERAAKEAAYKESLKTTPADVAKALEELVAGGDKLKVWIGSDGQLRMKHEPR